MNSLLPLFARDRENDLFDLEEEFYKLTHSVGWPQALVQAFEVLAQEKHKDFWQQAASIIYWAVSDDIALPYTVEKCAARLYRCLELFPGLGGVGINDAENLVWSIVSKLKGVSYESNWDPLEDCDIKNALKQLGTQD